MEETKKNKKKEKKVIDLQLNCTARFLSERFTV